MMAAFSQLFTPTVQFPRWYQPNKNIGAILVQTQEEEDELAARDWTPKPLPGSENPIAKVQSLQDVSEALTVLQSERDLFEQQKATFLAQMDARMAQMQAMMGTPGTPPVPPSPAPSPEDAPTGADMPGGLSDASDDVAEDPSATAPATPAKASKK